ncbi:MAG TPA: hypothetical protein ENJ53_05220 [Phaeodactylibacter sp.]|nr:hypothetical protein [Phaeodactylibacter sp.]
MAKLTNIFFDLADYDARWKTLVEQFPEQTLQKFFPNLAAQRDTSIPIKFNDKELQKILADWKKKGWTLADKLMEITLKNGKKKLALIHFEIHKSHDTLFKKLMWKRCYRIMDKNPNHDFTAVAIYIGKHVPPEPDRFVYKFEGTEITYKFNTFIVRDQDEKELLASNNPLDIAILAMWYVLKAGNDYDLLGKYKIQLARLCFQKGFNSYYITKLLIFVGFTVALPAEKEEEFRETIHSLIKEEDIMTLAEQYPQGSWLLEELLFGKSLEERDKEMKEEMKEEQIIYFFNLGLEIEKIALFSKSDKSFVEQVIADFQKNKK